jgi:hypothetical protein
MAAITAIYILAFPRYPGPNLTTPNGEELVIARKAPAPIAATIERPHNAVV